MLVAGLVVIAFFGLIIFLLANNVDSLTKPFLKFLGYFLLFVSSIELGFLIWILVYTWISPWSLWSLSFDAKDQRLLRHWLSSIDKIFGQTFIP